MRTSRFARRRHPEGEVRSAGSVLGADGRLAVEAPIMARALAVSPVGDVCERHRACHGDCVFRKHGRY